MHMTKPNLQLTFLLEHFAITKWGENDTDEVKTIKKSQEFQRSYIGALWRIE